MKVLTGSGAVRCGHLTGLEHPDVFSEHKVKTHRPPHALRCPHGPARTGFNQLRRLQGRSSVFFLLVCFFILIKPLLSAGCRWPPPSLSPASAPPPEGRRASQDDRDSTSTPSRSLHCESIHLVSI